jgi:hypothetical protein
VPSTRTRRAVKPAERQRDDFLYSHLGVIDASLDKSLSIPDVIQFAMDPEYLGRSIYPIQGTMLKVCFLQTEIFTDYDLEVIDYWSKAFALTGNFGCQPDLLERIYLNKAAGRPWFREWVQIIGRRGSKGFIGAIAGAYVLWHYLSFGDPQKHFSIDSEKRLAMMVFAAKKEQATKNQWGDIANVIKNSSCFQDYLPAKPLSESLVVYAPNDYLRILDRQAMGQFPKMEDLASFEILPKESTITASRGPAVFSQFYDEFAFVTRANAKADASEVWDSATPALDTFKEFAFIYEGSSPWSQTGQFYENWLHSLAISDGEDGFALGTILYPEVLMFQIPSWSPYDDFRRADQIALRPLGQEKTHALTYPHQTLAHQEYDEGMRQLERANPQKFKVERRCLDPETKILTSDLIWKPLREIKIGDQLVGFDEFPVQEEGKSLHPQRKLRVSTVLNMSQSYDCSLLLTFDDGSEVVCSGNHRWLVTEANGAGTRWQAAKHFKVGKTYIRHIVSPWDKIEDWDAGYLAGLFDGEGTMLKRARQTGDYVPEGMFDKDGNLVGMSRTGGEFCLSFTQNPGVVLDKTLEVLRRNGFDPRRAVSDHKAQCWRITNLDNCLRFLGQIRPERFMAKSDSFWVGRAPKGAHGVGQRNFKPKSKQIVAIEELDAQVLIDIETSTGTFLAEGFVSHNSHWDTVLDAYLNPDRVEEMFEPWMNPGDPRHVVLNDKMLHQGSPLLNYIVHVDPGAVNDNFALVVAHMVNAGGPLPHVVFDRIVHWEPQSFVDNNYEVDYEYVLQEMKNVIYRFLPDQFTSDQGHSVWMIQQLRKWVAQTHLTKACQVFTRTATRKLNWDMAEVFKTALNMGLLHSPPYDQARSELLFLQKTSPDKVEAPTTGPIQHDDVAIAMFNVVHALIGDHIASMVGKTMPTPIGSQMGGLPLPPVAPRNPQADESRIMALRQLGKRHPAPYSPARGSRIFRGTQPGRRR